MVTMTTMTALATLIVSPRWARLAALVMVGFGAASAAPAARAGEVLERLFRGLAAPAKAAHRVPPATGADGAVERLADELDWLEHHIDRFGSIVAKHPDIWGQSRLTRHRAEYERLLAAEAAPGSFRTSPMPACGGATSRFWGWRWRSREPPRPPAPPGAGATRRSRT